MLLFHQIAFTIAMFNQVAQLYFFLNLLHLLGCHTRAVPQADEPLVKWEETVDRFWQFISELNTHTDSVVENLKTDQLSRELE